MKIIYLIRGAIAKAIKFVNLPLILCIKFAAYFWLFHYVTGMDGFLPGLKINSLPIQIVLAVLSTILPNRCGVFLAILLGLANIWKVTMLGTAVSAILFLLVYITTSRLFPDHVYMLILVPLALHYKLYLMLPVVAGMYIGVIAIIPMILGVVFSILLGLLPEFMKLQMPEKVDAIPQMLANVFKYVFNQVLHNDTLIFLMILFTVVVVLIYLLRKIDVNYGNYIALLAGIVVGVVCISMGRMTFDITESSQAVIKNAVGTFLILAFCEFMRTALNYEAIQRLAFEDDEYEYHVTVIPKVGIPDDKKRAEDEDEIEDEEDEPIPEPEMSVDRHRSHRRQRPVREIPEAPAPAPKAPVEEPTQRVEPVAEPTQRIEPVQEPEQPEIVELWAEPEPEAPAVEEPAEPAFVPEPSVFAPEQPEPQPEPQREYVPEPQIEKKQEPAPTKQDDSIDSFFEED